MDPLVLNTFLFLFNLKLFSLIDYFDLHPGIGDIIRSPWTLISYSFFHIDFFHIFWNMLILYVVCKHFLNFLTNKKLIEIYFYGALFLGFSYLISGFLLTKNFSMKNARTLLQMSVIYLPALFLITILDRLL